MQMYPLEVALEKLPQQRGEFHIETHLELPICDGKDCVGTIVFI